MRGTVRNRRTIVAKTVVAKTVVAMTRVRMIGLAVLGRAQAVHAVTAAIRRRMVVKRMDGRRRHKIEGERKSDRNPLDDNHNPNSKPSRRGACSPYYAPDIVRWEVQMQQRCWIFKTFSAADIGQKAVTLTHLSRWPTAADRDGD